MRLALAYRTVALLRLYAIRGGLYSETLVRTPQQNRSGAYRGTMLQPLFVPTLSDFWQRSPMVDCREVAGSTLCTALSSAFVPASLPAFFRPLST